MGGRHKENWRVKSQHLCLVFESVEDIQNEKNVWGKKMIIEGIFYDFQNFVGRVFTWLATRGQIIHCMKMSII